MTTLAHKPSTQQTPWYFALGQRLRTRRWAWLLAVNLRILLGFALLPAGLKKILGEPFTDPGNSGPFHEFLHAFLATGFFYTFVGLVQVVIALLLLTQRFAALGTLCFFPVITAICVFCWSTAVYPTASVTTLMWLGAVALIVFDAPAVFAHGASATSPAPLPFPLRAWSLAGLGIFVFYLGTVAANGGVYRPRGFEPENPAFWTLVVLVIFPLVAWWRGRPTRAPQS